MRYSASTLLAVAAFFGSLQQVQLTYAGVFSNDTYEECVLNNIKGANDKHVVSAVRNACKHKTTPKRCRVILDKSLAEYADAEKSAASPWDAFGIDNVALERKESALHECIQECEKESLYERRFGECATD